MKLSEDIVLEYWSTRSTTYYESSCSIMSNNNEHDVAVARNMEREHPDPNDRDNIIVADNISVAAGFTLRCAGGGR